ncbi:HD domain-containing protein [archaeon]|nr:HD domain-containing protein [archaeon]
MNLEKIGEIAKNSSLENGCHGWEHTKRVQELVLKIGTEENADLEILEISALLHDIARSKEQICHAEEGAKKARELLEEMDYDKIEDVIHCIETHRFSRGKDPETLEAKILQDADKLDAMGAIGIARCFIYRGNHSDKTIQSAKKHFHKKLLKLKDKIHTQSAKKIAAERHGFLLEFLERLEKEEKGEL